jgi:di/tricarboxylate transporter
MVPEFLHPWIAVFVTIAVFVCINVRRSTPLDLLFLGALVFVTLAGILTPTDALKGFASPAVVTIACLFAIAAGLRTCGVLDWVGRKLLGGAKGENGAIWRLAGALITSSAFLLNTALVAMMAPVVVNWCRQRGVSPSKMLIPVSYLTILGGVCTLIGTSTTLVVNAKLQQAYSEQTQQLSVLREKLSTLNKENANTDDVISEIAQKERHVHSLRPMQLFELGIVGFPCAIVGSLFLLTIGRRLLPSPKARPQTLAQKRKNYLVEMQVREGCPLVGKTVEEAGLRHLQGLFLIEIDRAGKILTPVSSNDLIIANDQLAFVGVVNTIVELEKIPGLIPVDDRDDDQSLVVRRQRRMVEVVLSRSAPINGLTVRDAEFRKRYQAVVVAVHRNGEQLVGKIGDIQLAQGDTLLLQTSPDFISRYRDSLDFYLISDVENSEPRAHEKMPVAATIFLGLMVWLVVTSFFTAAGDVGWASPAIAALVAVVAMVLMRCMRMSQVRTAIDIQLLVTIASALGLGLALERSGAAQSIAEYVVSSLGQNPFVLLIVIYVMTAVMTELITNNAVAALMFPIAVNLAVSSGHSPRPFIIAITLAASLSFLTPIGYQTNLMVMGPGGYQPRDFLRCGAPISVLVAITALLIIPLFWEF